MTQPAPVATAVTPAPEPTAVEQSAAAAPAAPATTAAGTATVPAEEAGQQPPTIETVEEPTEVNRVLGDGGKGDIDNPSARPLVDRFGNEVVEKADDAEPEKKESE